MKNYFSLYIYLLFRIIFRFTPNFILKYFLILLSKVIYYFNKEHRHIADVNLTLAYNNTLSQKQKDIIVYKSYKSFLFNLYEFIENQYISQNKLLEKVKIQNEEVILNAIKNKRKIIIVAAHYGGWELGLPFMGVKYGTIATVNRKMNNPLMHEIYVKARDKNNIIMIDKRVAAKGMLKAFKNNHIVAVVIDQDTHHGVEIDFFGKKTMATDSTSRLALKFDALIIPAFTIPNDFRDYTVKFHDALDVREIDFKTDDKIKELTQMQADIIENQIKDKPEFWFWQHKRWKHFYKKLYKRGENE